MQDCYIPLLSIDELSIDYHDNKQYQTVVHEASLTITQGETVVLVGESGSGKSTLSQAIIGLLAHNGRISKGSIKFNGEEISHWSDKRFQTIRGTKISLIPQDPVSSLNPIKTIGEQVGEIFLIHRTIRTKKDIKQKVIELFNKVGLSQPELRFDQYPHELSGGMRQRVLIAIAIALKPQLIIADEPTSALDVTVQKQILELIEELKIEYGTAVLLITHDLGVAADYGNRIIVMKQGTIVEQGNVENILITPNAPYTKQLLADVPSLSRHDISLNKSKHNHQLRSVIEVKQLSKKFTTKGNNSPFITAIDDISFSVHAGTTHAIVGESGSGKTTTINTLLGIQKPTSGHILIDGQEMTQLKGESLRQLRKKIQLVQQNPFTSLDPKQTIFQIIEEPLLNFEPIERTARKARVMSMLVKVGLSENMAKRKPIALSGGQRQRVAIARALILSPEILVLDEAVSALDVTVQAQILRLLHELQKELGLTYLFISHDLAVVRQIADTVSVMRHGKIVEEGDIHHVFESPQHPYTQQLIAAIPGHRQLL